MLRRRLLAASTVVLLSAAPGVMHTSQPPGGQPKTTGWGEWVERDFPFFSSVLHVQGSGLPANNLTPRALVLNLGRDLWAAFDTDLLRIAAVWNGKGVTPHALAPGSYHAPDRKTPGGQFPAPEPDGVVWLANGIYPGWQRSAAPVLTDQREPAPSPEEVGRGPLAENEGRFKAIRLVRDGAVLEYTAAAATVREWIVAGSGAAVERQIGIGPSRDPLSLVVGTTTDGAKVALTNAPGSEASLEPPTADRPVWVVKVPPHVKDVRFAVAISGSESVAAVVREIPAAPAPRRWPQEVITTFTMSTANDAYVVDDMPLPLDNPWQRNIRLSDIQFLSDGTAVIVTLDGDLWTIRGSSKGPAAWRRFASGLHEPLTLAIRDDQIYVFDRNGIWRIRDTTGDGEADVHELFSNAFAQTADMREFPNTIRLAPNGEFVIAKGNQQATTIGKHNGTVLRISADGRRATVLGYGFRQPNLGVNVRTGLVTASDQQGHYIPTTPLHVVGDNQFYGFLSDKLPRERYPAPIADPIGWIPHATNASAMSQVWLFGAKMGPLTDGLVHIGFNRPELFRVLLNERTSRPQAAVVSITRAFDFPPLNGSVNPADGQLYLAGFQILGWGTTATRLAGLGRVRYTGAASTLPNAVVPMDKGVLLRFDTALDPAAATNPGNYAITSWHYKRTYQYGSPQFKADGTPGIDRLPVSSAYISTDRRAVFVAIPGMTRTMQMRVGWSLVAAGGTPFQESAYFTPSFLPAFRPEPEGFGSITVDLSPASGTGVLRDPKDAPSSASAVDEGKRLYQLYGCMACHSTDASVSRLGPSFKGLFGSERTYAKGALKTTADERYIRESILEPASKVVTGYERGESGMPSYAGVLDDAQVAAIVEFIKSVK